jgi:hypothetical protein
LPGFIVAGRKSEGCHTEAYRLAGTSGFSASLPISPTNDSDAHSKSSCCAEMREGQGIMNVKEPVDCGEAASRCSKQSAAPIAGVTS